jgi:DNA-binding MarR family transcriptional regulator
MTTAPADGSGETPPGRAAFRSRFAGPEQSPGFQLWRASNAWQRRIRRALEPHGLTHVQFVLLATTAWIEGHGPGAGEPVMQRDIAEAAQTDKMMTSQVLRALETRGLLQRRAHPQDARAQCISLTDAGRAITARALGAVEQADVGFFALLGEEGVARLTGALATLAGQTEPQPDADDSDGRQDASG